MKKTKTLIIFGMVFLFTVLMLSEFAAAQVITQWQCNNLANGCQHRGRSSQNGGATWGA